jgi:hypothetical protein
MLERMKTIDKPIRSRVRINPSVASALGLLALLVYLLSLGATT